MVLLEIGEQEQSGERLQQQESEGIEIERMNGSRATAYYNGGKRATFRHFGTFRMFHDRGLFQFILVVHLATSLSGQFGNSQK